MKDESLQLDEEPVRSVGDSRDEELLAGRHGEVRGGGEGQGEGPVLGEGAPPWWQWGGPVLVQTIHSYRLQDDLHVTGLQAGL